VKYEHPAPISGARFQTPTHDRTNKYITDHFPGLVQTLQ